MHGFLQILWTSFEFHQFRGHAACADLLAVQSMSTFFVEFKKVFQEQEQQQQISRS